MHIEKIQERYFLRNRKTFPNGAGGGRSHGGIGVKGAWWGIGELRAFNYALDSAPRDVTKRASPAR